MTNDISHMMAEDEFLEHYGKMGMKWGKRQSKKSSPSKVHVSADASRYNKIGTRVNKNGLDNLSNDDLAKLNKRKQLVADYKKNNPTKFDKGHNSVKKALTVVATITAVGVVGRKIAKSPITKLGARIVVDVLKNMATGASGPASGGTYVQVLKALT